MADVEKEWEHKPKAKVRKSYRRPSTQYPRNPDGSFMTAEQIEAQIASKHTIENKMKIVNDEHVDTIASVDDSEFQKIKMEQLREIEAREADLTGVRQSVAANPLRVEEGNEKCDESTIHFTRHVSTRSSAFNTVDMSPSNRLTANRDKMDEFGAHVNSLLSQSDDARRRAHEANERRQSNLSRSGLSSASMSESSTEVTQLAESNRVLTVQLREVLSRLEASLERETRQARKIMHLESEVRQLALKLKRTRDLPHFKTLLKYVSIASFYRQFKLKKKFQALHTSYFSLIKSLFFFARDSGEDGERDSFEFDDKSLEVPGAVQARRRRRQQMQRQRNQAHTHTRTKGQGDGHDDEQGETTGDDGGGGDGVANPEEETRDRLVPSVLRLSSGPPQARSKLSVSVSPKKPSPSVSPSASDATAAARERARRRLSGWVDDEQGVKNWINTQHVPSYKRRSMMPEQRAQRRAAKERAEGGGAGGGGGGAMMAVGEEKGENCENDDENDNSDTDDDNEDENQEKNAAVADADGGGDSENGDDKGATVVVKKKKMTTTTIVEEEERIVVRDDDYDDDLDANGDDKDVDDMDDLYEPANPPQVVLQSDYASLLSDMRKWLRDSESIHVEYNHTAQAKLRAQEALMHRRQEEELGFTTSSSSSLFAGFHLAAPGTSGSESGSSSLAGGGIREATRTNVSPAVVSSVDESLNRHNNNPFPHPHSNRKRRSTFYLKKAPALTSPFPSAMERLPSSRRPLSILDLLGVASTHSVVSKSAIKANRLFDSLVSNLEDALPILTAWVHAERYRHLHLSTTLKAFFHRNNALQAENMYLHEKILRNEAKAKQRVAALGDYKTFYTTWSKHLRQAALVVEQERELHAFRPVKDGTGSTHQNAASLTSFHRLLHALPLDELEEIESAGEDEAEADVADVGAQPEAEAGATESRVFRRGDASYGDMDHMLQAKMKQQRKQERDAVRERARESLFARLASPKDRSAAATAVREAERRAARDGDVDVNVSNENDGRILHFMSPEEAEILHRNSPTEKMLHRLDIAPDSEEAIALMAAKQYQRERLIQRRRALGLMEEGTAADDDSGDSFIDDWARQDAALVCERKEVKRYHMYIPKGSTAAKAKVKAKAKATRRPQSAAVTSTSSSAKGESSELETTPASTSMELVLRVKGADGDAGAAAENEGSVSKRDEKKVLQTDAEGRFMLVTGRAPPSPSSSHWDVRPDSPLQEEYVLALPRAHRTGKDALAGSRAPRRQDTYPISTPLLSSSLRVRSGVGNKVKKAERRPGSANGVRRGRGRPSTFGSYSLTDAPPKTPRNERSGLGSVSKFRSKKLIAKVQSRGALVATARFHDASQTPYANGYVHKHDRKNHEGFVFQTYNQELHRQQRADEKKLAEIRRAQERPEKMSYVYEYSNKL